MRFAGKVAVVTGAAQGIGKAHATMFAAEGASVVVVDVQADVVEQVAGELPSALGVVADVSDAAATLAMAEQAVAAFGGIDILINNAGGAWATTPDGTPEWGPRRTLLTELEQDWDRIIAVNLKGQYLSARAVVPSMKERGGGKIVNIGSVAGVRGSALPGYASAKAGVMGLTKAMARDLGPDNICVNAVAPGRIHSKDITKYSNREAVEAAHAAAIALQCVKRAGRPEDVAAASLFFASDAAGFITGEVLVVDGGRAIGV